MKTLILCSLVAVSVAFGVDCDDNLKLDDELVSCFNDNNADACHCVGYIVALASQTLLDSGNYNKAIEAFETSMKLIDRACKLGSKEACSSLDRINGEKK